MPASIEKRVLEAMFKAHPYEEVAYDIYPLDLKGEPLGFGRIGSLPETMKLDEFARFVKDAFECDGVRVVGDPEKEIRKVAILGGSGGRYLRDVKRQGADVYITGMWIIIRRKKPWIWEFHWWIRDTMLSIGWFRMFARSWKNG